jgi:hypothetical protein
MAANPLNQLISNMHLCFVASFVYCRLEAVNAYFQAVETLMFDLSIWRCR